MEKKKVDPEYLSLALRMVGKPMNPETIEIILDLIALLEEKGGNADIMDVCKLKAKWRR